MLSVNLSDAALRDGESLETLLSKHIDPTNSEKHYGLMGDVPPMSLPSKSLSLKSLSRNGVFPTHLPWKVGTMHIYIHMGLLLPKIYPVLRKL